MTLAKATLAVSTLALMIACGSSEKPEPKSATETPPAATEAPAEETPKATPAAKSGGDEGWEGENTTADKPADSKPVAGGKAPADTKGEETRTIEVIAKVVKDNRQKVRDCYEKALKDLPDLKGDMTIFFVVDPEGKVKKAELNIERSTLKAPPVVDCAVKVIKGIQFPPSSRGMETTANYPFNLNP
jgi:hypothetical protein